MGGTSYRLIQPLHKSPLLTCSRSDFIDRDSGTFPLSHVILGGEVLYDLDDYIMSLKMPWEVKQIAAALRSITENAFRDRYFWIDQEDYDGFSIGDEGYEYTWSWFQEVRELSDRAADAGRHVLLQRQLGIHL
ncbi:DUF1877 family protein [Chamaesiphon sp. OTE_20_metabat_361]|uniref:DUF1877 family protein n=1 Tax=Chamaesiphon sp. OTE_20_metabat_361 TaxID=2964689 RepID=UPI00286B0DF9|nr:DUF1877 family protein [Chamaesiphon sp. OTE_20_metabat_361]